MKIVALLASPHGLKGNTGRLLKIVLDGARTEGAKTEAILLNWKKVGPCLACDVCHVKGHCKQKDEFEVIKEKIMDADALVMATPNYIDNVSAQLKAFMDRCCGVVHCLGFEGKYGTAVVTSGGGEEKPIADMIDSFLIKTGVRPIDGVWITMRGLTDLPQDIREKALPVGKNIVEAVKNRSRNSKVEKQMNAFRERMKGLVLYRRTEWLYEYNYWHEKGEI